MLRRNLYAHSFVFNLLMIILYSVPKKNTQNKTEASISHSEEGVDIFSLKEVNGWYVNLQC